MRLYRLSCAALLSVACVCADDLVLRIPPVKASLDVKGQPLTITAWGTVSSASSGVFNLALTADLSELQANITPLLASQLNRSDRCGERLSVEHATIVPAAPAAALTVNVHYERWGCARIFGKDAVKRLVGGNGVVIVKLTPAIGTEGISVESEVQKIDADGSLGDVLRSGSFGAAMKEKITASIQSAMRKGLDLKSALPVAMEGAATIRGVRFTSSPEGRLWISAAGEVHLSDGQFQSLSRQLRSH